jgi:hypothetical protein
MAANPPPKIEYHEILANKIRTLSKDPSIKRIWLAYGLKPLPWAQLRTSVSETSIPIPPNHYPYETWRDWLQDYLEDQVALIGEEEGAIIYVLTSRGELQKARRKELIDLEA